MKMDLSHTSFHPPKGVLLVGVPGCGKSLSAKAIATQWNLPLYRLREDAATQIDRKARLIVYCNTGERISAAAYRHEAGGQ